MQISLHILYIYAKGTFSDNAPLANLAHCEELRVPITKIVSNYLLFSIIIAIKGLFYD